MRYLLDTCVVMNMIAEPDRLCPDVEALIDREQIKAPNL